jgi:hypothetical protein
MTIRWMENQIRLHLRAAVCRQSTWSGLASACLLLLFILAITCLRGSAQSVSATLSGTITDSSGAAIPDASVVAEQPSTGTRRATRTNSDGIFNIPLLQPGTYSLDVSKTGFSSATRSGIELQVNQRADVDIALSIGSMTQSVQVSGAAPLLETQTVELGTVVGSQEMVDLPMNGRQFAELLQLAPGTVPVDVSQNAGNNPIGTGAVVPSINGGTNRSNLFFIDGLFATSLFYQGYSLSPSVDAIQEFQEQTHAGQAEFGESTGGTVNISTKAGTNSFHGDAYEFIRNDVLDASNYFSPTRQAYKQNQFGGTLGGPILRNKWFAYGYYEGYRNVTAATNLSTLPTSAELGGDFSAILPGTVIYDPTTYDPATNTIQPFPNNMIPSGRLNQGVLTVLKAFLPANLPASPTNNNFVNTVSNSVVQNEWGIRSDYNVGARDLVYGHFLYQSATQSIPESLPGNSFPLGFGGKNAGGNWVHTYSPSLTSQITGGWNWVNLPGNFVQPDPSQLFNNAGFAAGFTEHPGGISLSAVPALSASGFFGINAGQGSNLANVAQISGSVTKQLGPHTLRFGAAYYRTTLSTNYANDSESFNQQATWNPCSSTNDGACVGAGGNSLASLVLGLPESASRQLGNSGVDLRMKVSGLYAQDSWKVTPKLAVDYGLRWDYTTPVTEAKNRLSGFNIHNGEWYIPKGDVDTPSVLPAGVYIAPTNSITPRDLKNFSPRLGFAYLFRQPTLIRAGIGITFDNWAGAIQSAQNARGGWPSGASQNVNNVNIAGTTPGTTAQNPFANLAPVEPISPYPAGGGFLDTAWKDEYSLQYNLELSQQLSNSQVLSFAYVGSSTSRASLQPPANQSEVLGPTQVLPFPQMSQFSMVESVGHMSYNAFQAKYDKRYENGLVVKGAFTWSKDIDVGCADFWEGCSIQNSYNLRAERSNSALDVPVVATLSAVYQLPLGRGRKYLTEGPASAILGGWHATEILGARSGTDFTPTINFDNANANGGTQRPNLTGDPNSGPHSVQRYFNTAAYSVAAPYSFGDAGRNSLRGPKYVNLDNSIFRDFPLYREANLEFRSEFFNVLNHPNFGNPDSTLGDPTFGTISSTSGNPRLVQFSLKLMF